MLTSINLDQRLYVLEAGKGHTCLGFDVAFERATKVANWLKAVGQDVSLPEPSKVGTPEGYQEYLDIMEILKVYCLTTGKRCEAMLSPQLLGKEGKRVEVITTYEERRRFQVGRSTGWLPIHLEVPNKRSRGGYAADYQYESVRLV